MNPSEPAKGKTGMIAVAVLVVGLLIGGGVGYGIGNSMDDSTDSASNSSMKSSDSASSTAASSESDGVTVGGAKMVESKDIVDNAVNAKNVTTVVAAVKAAGLVDTLKSAGPFTVFAPNNAAFSALPAGTVDTLLKPENKATLTKILTLHVIPGTYTSAALKVMAAKGEMLTSVQGEMLKPIMVDNQLEIQDPKGNNVQIETPDIISSNGVTFVIKSVLMPN